MLPGGLLVEEGDCQGQQQQSALNEEHQPQDITDHLLVHSMLAPSDSLSVPYQL